MLFDFVYDIHFHSHSQIWLNAKIIIAGQCQKHAIAMICIHFVITIVFSIFIELPLFNKCQPYLHVHYLLTSRNYAIIRSFRTSKMISFEYFRKYNRADINNAVIALLLLVPFLIPFLLFFLSLHEMSAKCR